MLGDAAIYILRKRAIKLWQDGVRRAEICLATGLSPSAVSKVVKLYTTHGPDALRPKQRGRPIGSCRLLTGEQEREVLDLLAGPGAADRLWTRQSLAEEVRQRFGAPLVLRTLSHYRSRWNMPQAGKLRQRLGQHPQVRAALARFRKMQSHDVVWVEQAGWQPPGYPPHNLLLATSGRGAVHWSAWPSPPDLAQWQGWLAQLRIRMRRDMVLVFADSEHWPSGLASHFDALRPACEVVVADQLLCVRPERLRKLW